MSSQKNVMEVILNSSRSVFNIQSLESSIWSYGLGWKALSSMTTS